jgi:hypothetical protein
MSGVDNVGPYPDDIVERTWSPKQLREFVNAQLDERDRRAADRLNAAIKDTKAQHSATYSRVLPPKGRKPA